MQIMSLPFFFGRMIIGDNHLVSLMGIINLVANNWSKSSLILAT